MKKQFEKLFQGDQSRCEYISMAKDDRDISMDYVR